MYSKYPGTGVKTFIQEVVKYEVTGGNCDNQINYSKNKGNKCSTRNSSPPHELTTFSY